MLQTGAIIGNCGNLVAVRRLIATLCQVCVWSLFLGLLTSESLHALDPRKSVDEYAIDTWNTETGLPHNQVHAIAQTPDGYLWFGTWEGAVRFNAREFRTFDRRRVPDIRDNGVRILKVDRRGALWLGTSRGGVSRLLDGVWSHFDRHNGLVSDEAMSLLETRDGRIWIGMEEGGISVIDGDKIGNFTTADGLLHNTVLALAEQANGDVWIATSLGLNLIRDGRISTPDLGPLTPTAPVLDVFVDSRGTTFVGTDTGLLRLVDGQLRREAPGTALDKQAIALTIEDRQGTLWIGTLSGGLIRYRDGQIEVLGVEQGLPHKRVIALAEDREGSLWIGTSAGLVRLKDSPFSTYGAYRGLSENYVRTVRESKDGQLWVGTGNGLNRLDGRRFTHYWPGGDPAGNYVMSLFEDTDRSVWVGTYDSGISRFDGNSFTSIDARSGLASDQVRAILRTRDGALWIGTTNGLNRMIDGKIERFGREHGLPREYVFSLFEEHDGHLIVGTTAGAARFNGHRFEALPMPADAEIKDFFGFHQTADGVLWAATSDGIARFRDGECRVINSQHGPIPDAIFNILGDDSGNFWMGSNRGVIRVARDDLDAVLDGRKPEFPARVFGKGDGLVTNQCNGGSQPSSWRGSDGRLWFATAKGVSFVDPARLDDGARPVPPIVIEELRINGAAYNHRLPIELEPGRHKIEFDFAGLSFTDPGSVRYRYRLSPYDPNWVETAQMQAVYTNLPPGAYRFAVQTALGDTPFGDQEIVVSIRIAPQLWQTRWFQTVALLALIAAIYGLLVWRTRALVARERHLSRLVSERTRELQARQTELLAANDEKAALLQTVSAQAEIAERQARTDPLTGLANRRHFDTRFAQAFARCRDERRPVAAAQLDIDHFKQINDRYSHAAGDEVIRALAEILGRHFPGEHGLVARYGGEEFVIGFPDTSLAEALARCERVREAVSQLRFDDIAPDLRVTVSVGVSASDSATTFEKLLAFADAKLYDAKRGGRNRVCS